MNNHLFYYNSRTARVSGKLWSIGTLQCRQSCFIVPGATYSIVNLQSIDTFLQRIEEEVGRCVFNFFVISCTCSPMITGKLSEWFEACCTLFFKLNEVHLTVELDDEAGGNNISNFQLAD